MKKELKHCVVMLTTAEREAQGGLGMCYQPWMLEQEAGSGWGLWVEAYSTLQVEKGERAWGQCEAGEESCRGWSSWKDFPVWIKKIRKTSPISSGKRKGRLANCWESEWKQSLSRNWNPITETPSEVTMPRECNKLKSRGYYKNFSSTSESLKSRQK